MKTKRISYIFAARCRSSGVIGVILALSFMTFAQISSACNKYDFEDVPPTADFPYIPHYRLLCDGFVFGSFHVKPEGGLIFRPHPDRYDENGWGTSWFMAPFLSGAGTSSGVLIGITASPTGIYVIWSGRVANVGGNDYGTWMISGTLSYDSLAQKVTASGNLSISLNGTLRAANRDLNLERLSSNYLRNVPLQGCGGCFGDTGDMKEAKVTYSTQDTRNFTWIPSSLPSHYPNDISTTLGIEVVGNMNNVDVLRLDPPWLSQIAVARKPSTFLAFSSADVLLSAGFYWDENREQDPAADNIGINHLVFKEKSDSTQMTFNFTMTSISAFTAVGVFRNGQWFLDANGNGAWDGCGTEFCFTGFGAAGDLPASGNWDGGTKSYIGIFRSGTGQWFTDRNGNRQWDGCVADGCYNFGAPGDRPVAGDWNGSGFAKIGVFRAGTWYLDANGNGAWDGCGIDRCYVGSFGQQGDLPVAGQW